MIRDHGAPGTGIEAEPLETPALVVDEEIFEKNLRVARDLAQAAGKHLRPHVKTHRAPSLALRQVDAEVAVGITCQTVGEAEVMADAELCDILIANEVVSPGKLARVARLAKRARLALAVDAAEPLLRLSAAALREQAIVGVVIDIDVGLGRCGVTDVDEVVQLAKMCRELSGVRFDGIMGYEGRLRAHEPDREARIEHAFARLAAALSALHRDGLDAAMVSASGTSTMVEALRNPNVTEVQAGCYALMEPELEELPLPFRCAVSVAARVISEKPGRIVVDAGRKSIGCDSGAPLPLGVQAAVARVSEEHIVLACDGSQPRLGDLVHLRPTHVRTTFNLHDEFWMMRNGAPPKRRPVSARGRSQ